MHFDLRFLLSVTPNILIVGTLIGWLLSILDMLRRKHVPKVYWLVQVTLTVLLPQLKIWPNRPLVSYLPNPLFPFLDSFMLFPYLHVAFILLPALVAMASILVTRSLAAYVLLASGTAYILLVLVLLIFFNGGAVA
jgi:hypothetical protein